MQDREQITLIIEKGIPYGVAFQMALTIMHYARALDDDTNVEQDLIHTSGIKCKVKLTALNNIKTIEVCKIQL